MFRATRQIDYRNPVSNSPLNRGLVSWWLALPQRMGGGRIIDLCSKGNHATLTNGPTWRSAAGRNGGFGSLNFVGGSSQYAPTTLSVASLTNFTLSAWVRRTATNDLVYIASDTGTISGNLVQVGFYSDGLCYYTADGNFLTISSNVSTWLHFAYCFNGSLGTDALRNAFYINGVSQSPSGTSPATSTSASAGNLVIGRRTASPVYTNGNIDDVRFMTRTLSADEVVQLYNDSRTGYQQTLNRLPMRVYGTAAAASGVFNPYYYRMLAGHGGLGGAA